MLCVLKEPSQWDGSFEHPKQMSKLMDKNKFNSQIYAKKLELNFSYT